VEQLPEAWRVVESVPDGPPEQPDTRARRAPIIALGILALALASAAGAMLALTPNGDGAGGAPATRGAVDAAATAPANAVASSPAWMVDVAGAVMRPGLYALPPGSRVADAIRAAGGYGGRVDASGVAATLNLAEVLHDGAKVVVPERGTSTASTGGSGSGVAGAPAGGTSAGGRIDLNRASASELDTLPGIGPVTAAKIIAAREEQPFQAVDDLLARKVVSASVMTKIRPLVTVGGG
jgi:competence protein ComEA